MATYPLIPTTATAPNVPVIFDDSGDSSDEDEIEPLDIDFGNLDGSEDEEDEFDEEEEDDDDEGTPALPGVAIGDLARLMNLGKPTAAFPMPTKRTQAQPVVPVPQTQPVVPVPQTRPVVPVPTTTQPFPTQGGLRLTLLPTVPTPLPVPTQLNVPTPFPVPTQPNVPKPGLTTLTLTPTPKQPLVQPKLNGPTIPQLGGIIPTTTVLPGIIQTTPVTAAPLIPQLQGLTLNPQPKVPALKPVAQPTVPTLPAQPIAKTVDVAAILEKMQGISVSSITPAPAQVPADINDMLQKETDETPEDFEARRRLTLQLASIPDYKLNNATAVTSGLIMMKKAKLGVSYDPDVEAAISYLTSLLQR